MEFYKETEFKDTEIGRIPKDWEAAKLEKVAMKIKAGGTPLTTIKEYWNGNVPFVKIEDMTSSFKYLDRTTTSITEKGLENSSAWIVPKNSLLLAMYGSLGEVAINTIPVATNQAILGIIPQPDTDVEYLYYWFLYYKLAWKKYAKPTTQANLTAEIVRKTLIRFPPLPEQQKIAEVLSTVDQAIQKTNEIIAVTERLKKGLMQQLLTKGIGHKEFKDTEIGRIPKEWEIIKLKDVVVEAKSGFACGKRDENGILQLRMNNIETEGWIDTQAGVKVPIPEDVEDYLLKPDDILFNNTNSVDLIGKTAIFKGEFSKCVYSNHLTRIRVNLDKVVPEWILYLLIRKWQLGVFKAMCHRHVHQAGINNEDLLNLKILLPPLQEQKKIILTLSIVDERLKLERSEKAKLEKIKKELMDLLLTGKVRVKVD